MRLTADKCDRCGKIVLKRDHTSSTDMVKVNANFLFVCDIKEGESSRPCLNLERDTDSQDSPMMCPDCLLEVVDEWVRNMNARGPSNILPEHIVNTSIDIHYRCPICHNIFSPK